MTAHATVEERQRCLAAGMNDHVAKPIDPAALFETVGRFYKPRRGAPATAIGRPSPAPQAALPSIAGLDTTRWPGSRRRQPEALPEAASPVRRATGAGARSDRRRARQRRPCARRAARPHAQGRRRQHRRDAAFRRPRPHWNSVIRDRSDADEVERARQQSSRPCSNPLVAGIRAALGARRVRRAAPFNPRRRRVRPQISRGGGQLAALLSDVGSGRGGVRRGQRDALRPLFDATSWAEFDTLVQSYAFADAQAQLEQRASKRIAAGMPLTVKDLSDSRMLIVDDAKTNIDILVQALRDEYKLSVALDGAAALRSIEKSPPDLVLLDIMMPGLDGYEVCRQLRAQEATREVPVMFLSVARGREGQGARLRGRRERLPDEAVRDARGQGARPVAAARPRRTPMRSARRWRATCGSPARSRWASCPPISRRRRGAPAWTFTPSSSRRARSAATSTRCCAPPDDRIVVALGDVSGKGIPAALFMAVAVTVLRTLARQIAEPDEILRAPQRRTRRTEPARHVRHAAMSGVRSGSTARVVRGGRTPPARDLFAGPGRRGWPVLRLDARPG